MMVGHLKKVCGILFFSILFFCFGIVFMYNLVERFFCCLLAGQRAKTDTLAGGAAHRQDPKCGSRKTKAFANSRLYFSARLVRTLQKLEQKGNGGGVASQYWSCLLYEFCLAEWSFCGAPCILILWSVVYWFGLFSIIYLVLFVTCFCSLLFS